MADMMLFPDTWEEFEKQYGFYDSKQAYMYGNTRLIPNFRVEQWLDHIDDIKRKKQSQKNKMEQVAALFGKRVLSEEFIISCRQVKHVALFSYDGLEIHNTEYDCWQINNELLADLLAGRAVIVDD